MADILERKIPYLFPGDLELRLDEQNFVTAISGYPVGGGGGTIVESDFIWKPVINQDGTIGWARDTSATTPSTANLVPHIYNNYWYVGTSNTNVEARGPQGEQGIQGETGPAGADGSDGTDGKTPELRINPSNAEWQWKYTVDNDWINLGVTASGAVGPQGQSGASGASGISPTVTTAAIPGEDGTRVTFTYGPDSDSTYIDVMNGTAGASGESGYSPTITTATTADAQHPQSGVNVTVTDIDGNKSFNIWNGIDGQGATVNLLEGDGIQITHESSTTNYTISVSADYSGAAVTSAKTWVGEQGYLTSVPDTYALKSDIPTKVTDLTDSADYAKKTDLEGFVTSSDITTQDTDYVMTTTGWKVLTLPGGGMTQVIHDTTLTGQGNANDNKLGVAWSALSGNTIASANSAYFATKAKYGDQREYEIGSEIYGLTYFRTSIINWTNLITGNSGIDVLDLDDDGYPETFQLTQTAYNAVTAVSNKLDTTAAAETYQTIAGMSDYLTTTVASQTYLDKTTYATDSATFVTSSNSTITGTDKYALTTTGWASVETAYLPLTGGTVTGQITLTGNSWDNRLTIGRSNTAIDIGVALNGALTLKANANNACQFNMMQTGTSGVDINITYGQTPTAIGNLYVMKTHTTAEATTASGSWNGDNLLHIILDS